MIVMEDASQVDELAPVVTVPAVAVVEVDRARRVVVDDALLVVVAALPPVVVPDTGSKEISSIQTYPSLPAIFPCMANPEISVVAATPKEDNFTEIRVHVFATTPVENGWLVPMVTGSGDEVS